jgi:hypothetical protein
VAARIGVAGPSLQPYFSKPEAVSRSVAAKREVVENITILIPRWKKAFASAGLDAKVETMLPAARASCAAFSIAARTSG